MSAPKSAQTPAAAPPEELEQDQAQHQPPSQISDARLEANRANAQLSTGPNTAAGKAKVRFNAVKNNLTGQHLIIREEDSHLYLKLMADYQSEFEPVGPREIALVQSLVDVTWRLNRIPALEMALLAKGQEQLVNETSALHHHGYAARLELEIRLRYEKEFRNLALQESRLARRRDRETADLLRLQTERKSAEDFALREAAKAQLLARHLKQPTPVPAGVGFAFSKQRFDSFMGRLNASARQMLLEMAVNEAANRAKIAALDAEQEPVNQIAA